MKAQAVAGMAASGRGRCRSCRPRPSRWPAASSALEIKWSKAPCRFCGTGCGVMVGVQEGAGRRTHGDMQAEVNRGLNCVKGYFLSKIMYGIDRLTTPLLRKKERCSFRQGRRVRAGVWDEAFDVMAAQGKATLKAKGSDRRRHVRLGPVDDLRRLCRDQADAAGFRSNNSTPTPATAWPRPPTRFMRTFGMDEPMGCYDDFEHADAFVLWGSNMAEMHPILWTRVTDRTAGASACQGRCAVDLHPSQRSDLADIPIVFKPGPISRSSTTSPTTSSRRGGSTKGLRRRATPSFQARATDIGYGLRPDNPLEQVKAPGRLAEAAAMDPIDFDAFKALVSEPYTLEKVVELTGSRPAFLEQLAELYADPKHQGHVALDDGVQPACRAASGPTRWSTTCIF
jgi:nitrate reductase NapA